MAALDEGGWGRTGPVFELEVTAELDRATPRDGASLDVHAAGSNHRDSRSTHIAIIYRYLARIPL